MINRSERIGWLLRRWVLACVLLFAMNMSANAADCKAVAKEWQSKPDFKVMVQGKSDCWLSWDQSSLEDARKAALSACKRMDRSCKVVKTTNEKKYWALVPTPTLCKKAIDWTDVTKWVSAESFASYVLEAKRRGLTTSKCRLEIGLRAEASSQQFQGVQTPALCSIALNKDKSDWDSSYQYIAHVAEAQRRSLSVKDCKALIASTTEPKEQRTKPASDPEKKIALKDNAASSTKSKNLSFNDICKLSLNADMNAWSSGPKAIEARKQADLLGITIKDCRLKLGVTEEKTASAEEKALGSDKTTPDSLKPSASHGRRIALVVGINDYENLPRLQKAVNDSRAVSKALTHIGYDVVSVENPDRRTLSKKLSELQSKIQVGDNALFYFAGHGVAMGGENILIAKDMPKPASGDEDLVRDEGFSVDDIVRRIQKQGAKTAFLVLDACRDNPFEATGTRSIGNTRGLAKTDTPSGVFVLFSAGIGQAALDRLSDTDSDPNSVFTRKLIPALAAPAVTHIDLAKTVQKEVAELASTINHQQQPAYYDQIIGEVVINPQ